MPPRPTPQDAAGWQAEIRSAFSLATAALALGELPEDEVWHGMEDQAVARGRAARGLDALAGTPAAIDQQIDAITEITELLRRHGGGDPDDHHISPAQFFLLYYLAAQVHAGSLSEVQAGAVVRDLWEAELAPDVGGDDEADDAADDADDADEPWPITRPTPRGPQAWVDEVIGAWRICRRPPPLAAPEGPPVIATGDDLREAAVVLALYRRGVKCPSEDVWALIGVISGMEEDIDALGPELADFKQVEPLAFTLYYMWSHICIGHADEDVATAVVQDAAARLGEFPRLPPRNERRKL